MKTRYGFDFDPPATMKILINGKQIGEVVSWNRSIEATQGGALELSQLRRPIVPATFSATITFRRNNG